MSTLNRSLTVLKSAKTCFFLLGFAIAAWAPLVPFVQSNLAISKLELSLMILTMGVGSISGMLLSTVIVKVKGTRFAVFFSGLALCLSLIAVASMPGFILEFVFLFIYGIAMGWMEVAVNLYGSELEKQFDRPLMSGFHGFYSVGQIIAVLAVTLLISCSLPPLAAVSLPVLLLIVALIFAGRAIENKKVVSDEPFLVMPKGFVIILAVIALCALTIEGAAIDWTGLLLIDKAIADPAYAASGYLVVVLFMAIGRFLGARILRFLGEFKTLVLSVLLSGCALGVIAFSVNSVIVFAALALLGLSLANILPLAVSFAGRQQVMPQAAAVAAVSSCGYAAITFGPAVIGSIGTVISLSGAFALLGFTTFIIGLFVLVKKHVFNQ